jgi:16S rRNA (cytosine1402-N4)-methyltransferase
VLVRAVVTWLAPRPDGTYVDCTVGLGGHTRALVDAGAGRVIGLDRDPSALEVARERLAAQAARVTLVHADYRDLAPVLDAQAIGLVDGIVADLGVSSMQLDDASRGFSFRIAGPLDMRMDPTQGATLADRLADVDEADLADVIFRFGEERHSRRVARAIVRARDRGALADTAALASVVRGAAGGGRGWQRIDPATRTFQALRIWVNGELDGLERFVETAAGRLKAGARLAVIAFHSLEDRAVKHTLRRLAEEGRTRLLTRRPIVPDEEEIARNARARSARLRVAEGLA